jgi:hypothetical protein
MCSPKSKFTGKTLENLCGALEKDSQGQAAGLLRNRWILGSEGASYWFDGATA